MTSTLFGFRLSRHRTERWRLLDRPPDFANCAGCDREANFQGGAYLSQVNLGLNCAEDVDRACTEKDRNGRCRAGRLYRDIGRPSDLELVLRVSRRLAWAMLDPQCELDDHDRRAIPPFRTSAERSRQMLGAIGVDALDFAACAEAVLGLGLQAERRKTTERSGLGSRSATRARKGRA